MSKCGCNNIVANVLAGCDIDTMNDPLGNVIAFAGPDFAAIAAAAATRNTSVD